MAAVDVSLPSAPATALTRTGASPSRRLDLLVGNDVAESGSGFGTDTNRVTLFARDAEPDPWPMLSKREVGDRLLDRVVAALDERDADAQNRAMTHELTR